MTPVEMLAQAHAVGLRVTAQDGRLVVRGPRAAAPLAKALLAHKAELLALLDRPVIPSPVPGQCAAGVTPCAQPARLYPCGWRCPDHTPARLAGRAEPEQQVQRARTREAHDLKRRLALATDRLSDLPDDEAEWDDYDAQRAAEYDAAHTLTCNICPERTAA